MSVFSCGYTRRAKTRRTRCGTPWLLATCSNCCSRPNCHPYQQPSTAIRVLITCWMTSWRKSKQRTIVVQPTLKKMARKNLALNGKSSFSFFFFENKSFATCNSDQVVFSITKGNMAQSIDESYLHGTIAELFGHAKSKSLLSESDTKSLKIPLRLFVYPKSLTHVEVGSAHYHIWANLWLIAIC